jgi:signal transduction histidine kinase
MAIAKKIIEGHQGKIHINSHPGKGTEITIELPTDKER